MKTAFLLLIFSALQGMAIAQVHIKGRITDAKGEGLAGANVFVKNTYEGTSADTSGRYDFITEQKGEIILVISFLGYEPLEKTITVGDASQTVDFKLKEQANELNTVVISAGAFEASEIKKSVMLRPLDIVTTAGATADIYGAIQTLPGAQRVGETEGLFVRGGSAAETKTLIDGMVVENPFFSSTPDVAQRGRFSPFLFKGTVFSTGGYSAQYGQALSSVLALETKDLADSTLTSVGLMVIGPSFARTKRWEKTSLSVEGNYANLAPLFKVIRQNIDWEHAPEYLGGTLSFRHKPSETSVFKVYGTYNYATSAMSFYNFSKTEKTAFSVNNNNVYLNSSCRNSYSGGKWILNAGTSYSYNHDNLGIQTDVATRHQERTQGRVTMLRTLGFNSSVMAGAEVHHYIFGNSFNQYENLLHDTYSAAFAETDVYITRKLAARAGIRGEYSALLQKANFAPRASLAFKTGQSSQVSFAWGQFYQQPENRYLFTNQNLDFEKATHYVLNYQYMKERRTFRIEAYRKDYEQLVKELDKTAYDPNQFRQPGGYTNNSGHGYAQGFDIFWRDQKTFKRVDYWISYSYLDTKRDYQNLPGLAMPAFASRHNLSIVYKQFIPKITTSVGVTYSIASGRPYYNPNNDNFHSDLTRMYSNLSTNISYLTSIRGNFTILFISATNILATRNVFGYRYSPDGTERIAVGPAANRGFFAGLFVSLKKS